MGKGQLNTCSHKLLLMVSFGSCHCSAFGGGGEGLWGAETSEILLKEEIVEVMRLGGNRLCWCRVLERGQ